MQLQIQAEFEKRRKKRLAFYSQEFKEMKKKFRANREKLRRLRVKDKNKAKLDLTAKSDRKRVLFAVKPLLTHDEFILLQSQLNNTGRKKRVYTDEFKQLVLSMSYKSTAAYKYLARKLNLPSKRIVSRWVEKVHFEEGFCDDLFDLLAERVKEMEPRDRVISLLADEMSLKELLQYEKSEDKIWGVQKKNGRYTFPSTALVFMASGMKKPWRQALSYNFAKGAMPGKQLVTLIKECILKLHHCGLRVANITTDQGSNFGTLLKAFGVTPDSPSFLFDGHMIHITPDPPHLIKSARTALYNHTFVTKEGEASWDHIRLFYEHDKLNVVRKHPNLTPDHLDPPPIWGKMKVRLASQVLSLSTAKGIRAYVATSEVFDKNALATASCCEMFNNIFDVMNSSVKEGSTMYKSGLSPNSKASFAFIDQAIDWLENLTVWGENKNEEDEEKKKEKINITDNFKWIKGMIMALNSIKELTLHVCIDLGFDFFLTRRLNQDPLENYFGIIRQKNGFNSNPTCLGFSHSFKIIQCN